MNQEVNVELLFQMIGEQQVAIRMANVKIQELAEENRQLAEKLKKHEPRGDDGG